MRGPMRRALISITALTLITSACATTSPVGSAHRAAAACPAPRALTSPAWAPWSPPEPARAAEAPAHRALLERPRTRAVADARGWLPSAAARQTLHDHHEALSACITTHRAACDQGGAVTLGLLLDASGHVVRAGVAETTLADPALEGCLLDVLRRARFVGVRGDEAVVRLPIRVEVSPRTSARQGASPTSSSASPGVAPARCAYHPVPAPLDRLKLQPSPASTKTPRRRGALLPGDDPERALVLEGVRHQIVRPLTGWRKGFARAASRCAEGSLRREHGVMRLGVLIDARGVARHAGVLSETTLPEPFVCCVVAAARRLSWAEVANPRGPHLRTIPLRIMP